MSLASRFQGSRNASRSNPKQTAFRRKAILAAVSHLSEPLEARRLLSDTPLVSVWTDQADYGFGTTAHIQAEYFVPGSTVNFHLAHQAGTPTDANACQTPQDWQVVDGGAGDLDQTVNGSVQTTWDVTDPDAVGATYVLTATGETEQGTAWAETTFTDGTIDTPTASPNPFSPNQASSVGLEDTTTITVSTTGNVGGVRMRIRAGTLITGTIVREFSIGSLNGTTYVTWDGKDDGGSFVVDGTYTARVFNGSKDDIADPSVVLVVDDTNPASPGVALVSDTGISAVDRITSNGTLALTGVEAGATVQYSTNGGLSWASNFAAVEGSNSVRVRQTDVAGNVGPASAAFTFTLDTTKPILSASINSPAGTGWYNSSTGPAVVTYAASDIGGSGVTTPAPYTFTDGAGQSIADITVTDVAGNTSIPAGGFSGIYQDRVAPSLSGAATTLPNANGWYNSDVTVYWTASDALSGLDPTTVPADATITGQGVDLSASASVRDQAGNSAIATVGGIKIDRTAPSTNATASGTKGLNDWYVSNVTVSLATEADLSGIAGTYYRIDGDSSFTAYSGPFTVSADGPHTVTFYSVDKAGNSEATQSISFKIDQTAPILSASINAPSATGWYNIATGPAIITYTASDATSGVTTPAPFTFADGIGLSHAGITVTDAAGNTSLPTADVTGIMQDTIAPVLSASINAVTGTNGWYNASGKATVTYAVVENGSGAATPAPYVFGDGANQSLAAITIADAAGNVSNFAGAYNGISQDTIAPTIVASRMGQDYADAHSGWNNSVVTVSFVADDSGSGVSNPADQVFSADGVYTSDAKTVTDVAGNISAPANTFEIKIDQTAPTISGAAITSPNANGWYKTDVTVHFTAGSDLSGVASLTPDTTISTEGAGQSATGTVTDVAGNSASVAVTGINIDKTAPDVSAAATRGPADTGWYNQSTGAPVIHFNASDSGSGVDSSTVPEDQTLGEGSSVSTSATIYDLAGNSAVASIGGLQVDTIAPTIAITSPANGASYLLNAVITPHADRFDAMSGIAGGSAPSTVDTSTVGTHTYTVTAIDKAGNDASMTNTYTVTYQATAFLNPISLGRTFKQGSTIPIQWQLMDANGKAVTTLDAITSLTVTGPKSATLFPGNYYSSGATVLRNDGSQYIYNWQTKGFATGAYTITAKLKDGNSVTASIALSTSGGAAKLMIDSSAAAAGGASAGELLAGNMGVFVDNANGLITADEMARISDAMATINATIGRYGAKLYQVDAADASAANVFLSIGDRSVIGGYAEGILGVTTESGGSIKLINGWNWFAGAEASQIGSGQYDFQTVLTHELGHVLGLGHSDTSGSVMYATLGQASVKRALTFADLQIADTDGEDVAPLRATPAQAPAAMPTSKSNAAIPAGKFNAAARIQLTVPKAVAAIEPTAAQPPATPVASTPVILGTKRRIDDVFGRIVAALEN